MDMPTTLNNPFSSRFLDQSNKESIMAEKRKQLEKHELQNKRSIWKVLNIFGLCCTKEKGQLRDSTDPPNLPVRYNDTYDQNSLLLSFRGHSHSTKQAASQQKLFLLRHYKYAILAINTSIYLDKKVQANKNKRSFEFQRESSLKNRTCDSQKTKHHNHSVCIDRGKQFTQASIEEESGLDQVTPERIANYLAQRMASHWIILDAFAGAGGNTIAFGQQCDLVIAIEKDRSRCHLLQNNVSHYRLAPVVETLHSDFLSSSLRISADLTFLHPDYLDPPSGQPSLFHHVFPPLVESLQKAFKNSQQVCLLLPPWTRQEELPRLFGKGLQGVPCMVSYSIEVQSIYVDAELTHLAVYFGIVNDILNSAEQKFLTDYLTSSCATKHTTSFVQKQLGTLGVKSIVALIGEIGSQELPAGSAEYLQLLETKLGRRKSSRQIDVAPSKSNSDRFFSFEKPQVSVFADKLEPMIHLNNEDLFQQAVLKDSHSIDSEQQKTCLDNGDNKNAVEPRARTQKLTMSVYSDCDIFNAEESLDVKISS